MGNVSPPKRGRFEVYNGIFNQFFSIQFLNHSLSSLAWTLVLTITTTKLTVVLRFSESVFDFEKVPIENYVVQQYKVALTKK